MTDDKKLALSRRKVLAGLGTVGVASAGAGVGTFAAFNDKEQGNATFTAGELDLKLHYNASYNDQQVTDGNGPVKVREEEEGATILTVDDVKPGDVGSLVFNINSTGASNPAWVLSCINIKANNENDVTEPESDAPGESTNTPTANPGDMHGELPQKMKLIGFYDSNTTSNFFDNGTRQYDEDGPVPTAFWDNAQSNDGYYPRTVKDLANSDLQQGTNGNTATDDGEFVGCIILDGEPGNSSDNTKNSGSKDGLAPLPSGGDINFGYDWHVPFNVGNIIQTDSMTLEFKFYAIQARHSGLPSNADKFVHESASGS